MPLLILLLDSLALLIEPKTFYFNLTNYFLTSNSFQDFEMAAPKSDIISTAIETQKDQDAANSKQKLLVPRRIMEEEVWLSGSELKTDNSSSDEERGDSSVDSKDRAKKGAKKKTKTISQSARNRTKILREYHQQETITETFRSVKEVTSSTTTSSSTGNFDVIVVDTSEVEWRPKRGSITLPGLATELERVQI